MRNKRRFVREFRDHGPEVIKCRDCGTVYLNPLMDQKSYEDFYNSDDQKRIASTFISENYDEKIRYQAQYRKDLLSSYLNESIRILDVGCGYGSFIAAVQDDVKSVAGLEPSRPRALYNQNNGRNVIHGTLEDWPVDQPVDIITLFQVLEHIVDPKPFLSRAADLLQPGGRIVIEVPNHDDLIVRLDKYAWFYYQNAHCTYFDRKSLGRLLSSVGLQVEADMHLQRYSLGNHLHWLRYGRPGALHVPQVADRFYSSLLARSRFRDTLFLVVRRA